MYLFLRNYRAIPHSTTGIAPATALFCCPFRAKLEDTVSMTSSEYSDPIQLRQNDINHKFKIKVYAEARRSIKESDIQVGDAVLVKQPKTGKLSIPYNPSSLTVTDKNHTMVTAENETRRVTRISAHFKKLSSDQPIVHFKQELYEGVPSFNQQQVSPKVPADPISRKST